MSTDFTLPSIAPLLTVLSNRHFRRLWMAQVLSQLAINMMLFLLGLILYKNTGSNAAVSGIFFSFGVPAVVFGMLAGTIVDRLDRRAVLVACDLARAALVGLLYFVTHQVGMVYLLVFLNAVINQFYVPSEAPTIPKLVPKHFLVTANSLFSFTYYSSMALGFIAAGPILRLLGPGGSLLAITVLFLAAAVSVSGIPPQGEGWRTLARIIKYDFFYILRRILDSLSAGIRYVSQSPALLDALLLLTGTQIILAILGTLGPGFADQVLKIDVRDASLVIVGPTVIGIILGALWVGNVGYRVAPRKLIHLGMVSAGVILILVTATVGVSNTSWFAAVPRSLVLLVELLLFFLLGVANSLLDVPANSVLQKEAEGSMRGRVYGILAAAVGGVGILPVVVGGVLADVIGVGKVIFLLGLVVLSYGVYRIRYNRS